MVFWGSRPFSPQQVWQTLKRIHRIGQKHPVVVNHIIAPGSVDGAIKKLHKDKSGLAAAVVDGDWSSVDAVLGNWKDRGRIVDSCLPVGADGNFIDDLDLPAAAQSISTVLEQQAGREPSEAQASSSNTHRLFNVPRHSFEKKQEPVEELSQK
jgi:hypothetical protein